MGGIGEGQDIKIPELTERTVSELAGSKQRQFAVMWEITACGRRGK